MVENKEKPKQKCPSCGDMAYAEYCSLTCYLKYRAMLGDRPKVQTVEICTIDGADLTRLRSQAAYYKADSEQIRKEWNEAEDKLKEMTSRCEEVTNICLQALYVARSELREFKPSTTYAFDIVVKAIRQIEQNRIACKKKDCLKE